MEVNAEINKIFGTEMAKLVSQSISEDEIMRAAQESWHEINRRGEWKNTTQLDDEVRALLLERVRGAIKTILDSEPVKADIDETAQRIVKEIRGRAEAKIIENVSDRVASLYTGYRGYGLEEMIAEVVQNMLRR